MRARCGAARPRPYRTWQARQPRVELFLRRRSDADLRSRAAAAPAARGTRRRGGADRAAGDRVDAGARRRRLCRSEEHTSELQSLMRISYAVFCLKKNTKTV